jgi:class 3 adenylate cyclase/predicted ATPase
VKFSEVLEQASVLLQRRGRLTYRTLKREFDLDDAALEDLKFELIDGQQIAADEGGTVLVWKGVSAVVSPVGRVTSPSPTAEPSPIPTAAVQSVPDAERRQLTVLFCDLVGSTALSAQLDPEDYRTVVRQYQQTCTAVIQRYDGYLAQYLGDGLLVYFGYPTAHEDDARRAVRTGLEIVEAIRGQAGQPSLQVRIGIHTGLVVVGAIGAGSRTEQLALGETPNLAARLQGLAEPNTVVVSAVTHRLIEGQFECQPFGSHILKGIDTPVAVYHVQSERQGVSPLAGRTTLTPLVGREQEVGLLLDRWEQVKEGRGQVVLLSGEPGIGKSRLAYTLREHVTNDGSLLFEARCSPYHQHSALYPLIEALQRTLLLLARQDADNEKVEKVERALTLYNMQEAVPLFTTLLSLPTPAQYPSLNLTPQKQKERTLQALVRLLLAQAERHATVSVWEDLHWADPSSLEFLTSVIEQVPTTKLLLVLTFRPEFIPPWKTRSHLSQLVLNRLGKKHVEAMIVKVAERKGLPAEVIEQIRLKTDGVPLFVEEVTKTVLESGEFSESVGSGGGPSRAALALGIPATLQEALLARLDRLSTARQVAQLGATVGREFSHDLIQAVAPLSEADLHAALAKLVEAEILYHRGVGEQARYLFKHALIQEASYQSLLKSTRQQYHKEIAIVLEGRFPEMRATQPELLAHHYTQAGLIEQAIPYWQQAGQKAIERSANAEAIAHLTRGLELLKTLPDTPERAQQELTLQVALGGPLVATKGFAAPDVEHVYGRARDLCQQVGETPQLFAVLMGLFSFYFVQRQLQRAHELEEQLLSLAHRQQDPTLLLEAHHACWSTARARGDLAVARVHAEQGLALYDPQRHRAHTFLYTVHDPGVCGWSELTLTLWLQGYPAQALQNSHKALALAHELINPFNLAFALHFAAILHQLRREVQPAQAQAEATITLSAEQGFSFFLALGTIMQGWALAEQGQEEDGIAQIRQGLASLRATGAETTTSYFLALLAKAYGKAGRVKEGLAALTEALTGVDKSGERFYEAELYRLKGTLTLQSQIPGPKSKIEEEAEACFHKAIEIARQQQAKSLELRATMSLARLRQQQATQPESRATHHETRVKLADAHRMLSEIYSWFTEGFDTKDLQEAKVLLEELT